MPRQCPVNEVPVSLSFYNRGTETVSLNGVSLRAQTGKGSFEVPENCLKGNPLSGGGSASCRLAFDISPKAGFTEPFWHLENPDRCALCAFARARCFCPVWLA